MTPLPDSSRVVAPQEIQDLPGPGMPAQGELREDHRTVDAYLESTSRAMDQLDRHLGKLRLDLGRQTSGPGLVVSDDTILNSDLHHGSRCIMGTS